MQQNVMAQSDLLRAAVGPATFIGGLVLGLLTNVASTAIPSTYGKLALYLLAVIMLLAGAVFTIRLMPPLGLWVRTRVLQFLGRDKVIAEQAQDLARLSVSIQRSNKLIKLLNNLEAQMIEYLTHPGWTKPKKGRFFKQLLRSVAEGAGAIVPREPGDDRRCIILAPRTIRNKVVLKALAWNVDVDDTYANEIQFDTREGIAGKVFSEGRSYYAPDVTKDEVFKPHPDSPYKYLSLLVCPAKGPDGVTRGVLSLDNTRPDAYSQDDQKRFEWLALRLGVILYIGDQQPNEEGRKQ